MRCANRVVTSGLVATVWIFVFVSLCEAGDVPVGVVHEKHVHPVSKINIWTYHPKDLGSKKLPCVLIAAAGSSLFHGVTLGDGDMPEHTPYAQTGFFVVAYDVSGPLDNRDSSRAIAKAAKEFMDRKGGVSDALEALEFAKKKYDLIDENRVYAVGHSSAGTVAIALVQRSRVIKGCVAYAPIGDIESRIGEDSISWLDHHVNGFRDFILDYSPISNVKRIECPVYIFNSSDDANVTPATIERLVALMQRENIEYVHKSTDKGGHYYSMLHEGIPTGIEWLKAIESFEREQSIPRNSK